MGDEIALTGGVTIEVKFRDNKTPELVKILALAIEDMIPLLEATDHELRQIAMYCGKVLPAGGYDETWAKTLTRESQVEVIEKGEEANADFFGKWMERRTRRMDRLTRALPEKIKEAILPSNSSPPRPQ